jgi:transcriptional regulator with XRE-family HTH domain
VSWPEKSNLEEKSSLLTELQIAISLSRIAIAMKLGEKLRYLREVEGSMRGLDRAMTQQELVQAIKAELKTPLSQSYLSQIESGARPHLTNTTRQILAKFFKVHPGYLVDDPEGYHAELMSEARVLDDKLDLWLVNGAERFPRDAELRKALLTLAKHPDSRQCLLLMESLIETPGLIDRLIEVLRPTARTGKRVRVQTKPRGKEKTR